MPTRRMLVVVAAAAVLLGGAPAQAQDKSIVVASTTSTQDSGLFGHILPLFKTKTGIDVKVISQGTGQALDTGRRGDADVVFVHARPQEEKFVADGAGVKRYPVMYNDFILVGPRSDPAGAKGEDIVAGLTAIKAKAAPFISRGDNVLRLAQAGRIGAWADQHEVVVHHRIALHAEALSQEFLLGGLGMDEHHVGVAAPPGVERLAGAQRHDLHVDAGTRLEQRQ